MYCDNAKTSPDSGFEFEIKPYTPHEFVLQEIATSLRCASEEQCDMNPPWLGYLREGLDSLGAQSEHDFHAPPADSDKLYMSIGDRDLIEVAHPIPQDSAVKR